MKSPDRCKMHVAESAANSRTIATEDLTDQNNKIETEKAINKVSDDDLI